MRLRINGWRGTLINDGVSFRAWIPPNQTSMPNANANYVTRYRNYPLLGNTTQQAQTFTIRMEVLGNIASGRDTLRGLFDTSALTNGTLTFQDTADSNRGWSISTRPIRVTEENPNEYVITFALDEPYLRTSAFSTDNWTVTSDSSDATYTITTIGNVAARPQIKITPTVGKKTASTYFRDVIVYNPSSDAGFTRYPLNITPALDTAALVSGGKASSDGANFRVFVNGAEEQRFFGNFDSTDTKTWININLPASLRGTLGVDIAPADAVTNMQLAINDDNYGFLTQMSTADNKVVLINSEAFTFAGVDLLAYTLTGVSRARLGTTAGTHTIDAPITYIPNKIVISYGDTDPAISTSLANRPLFALTASSNTTWNYTNGNYNSLTSPTRPAAWIPSRTNTKASMNYTADHITTADPSSEMGMAIKSLYLQNIWRAQSSVLTWTMYHPAGITEISAKGEKYRYRATSGYPTLAGLQSSLDGRETTYSKRWYITPPTANATWQAFTYASSDGVLPAGSKYVRFIYSGSAAAVTSTGGENEYSHAMEIDDVVLTLNSAKVPQVIVGAEQAIYILDAKIKNVTQNQEVRIKYTMETSQTLIIDCDNLTVTYLDQNAIGGLSLNNVRNAWMTIKTGDVITYTENGVKGVNVDFVYRNRNTI